MVIAIGTIAKFASAEQHWPQPSRAMSIDSNELNDEHPLVLELSSLRQTAARFQHEAHQAALKLQRNALAAAQMNLRLHTLESQHSLLVSELDTLRAHTLPSPQSQSDTYVVPELTLALRRSSEKLDLVEHTLAERTAELVSSRSDALKVRYEADGAYKLAASARAREEEVKVRERETEARLRAVEEERKLIETVVHEYADLVRSLEGRKSSLGNDSTLLQNGSASASSLTLVEGLYEGKSGLQRLMSDFASENEKRESTIAQLREEIANLESVLDSERKTAAQHRTQLTQVQLELATLKLDDTTAAKMVSRYMKFSQSQTNALQSTLTTLQTRHASTQHTLQSTLNDTEARLHAQMTENARLRDALEELGEELAREAYGRRREVALRLALLAREEAVGGTLRKWVRRAQEGIYRCTDTDSQTYAPFERAVKDAESLLVTLDADLVLDDESKVSGTLGRLVLAKDAVMRMSEEVVVEMRRRVAAERELFLGVEALDEAVHEQSPSVSEKSDSVNIPTSVDISGYPTHKQDTEPTVDSSSINTDIPHTQDAIPASPQTPTPHPSLRAEGHRDTEGTPSPVVRELTLGTPQPLADDLPAVPNQSPTVSTLDLAQTPASEVASISPPSVELSPTPLTSMNALTIEPIQPNDNGENPVVKDVQGPLLQFTTEQEGIHTGPLEKDKELVVFTSVASTLGVAVTSAANEPSTVDTVDILEAHLSSTLDEISFFLSSLSKASHRYDALQRSFRDCSLALKDLKRTLPAIPSPFTSPTPSLQSLLRTALERISDYTEDARVELEIRIADEALAIRGFETLLTVPGALSPDSNLEEVRAFIDGTDEGVRRARERLEGKLDDVQHDVAVIKRTVHELQFTDDKEERDGAGKAPEDKSWSAWTANLLPRPPTPTPSQDPAFGSVMISSQLQPSIKQLPSLTGLELKIPMPLIPASASLPTCEYGMLGIGPAPSSHTRTVSMMYSLGIGSRASSLALPGMQPVKSVGARLVSTPLGGTDHDRVGDRNESDVE